MKKILPPSFWRHAGAVMLSLASGPAAFLALDTAAHAGGSADRAPAPAPAPVPTPAAPAGPSPVGDAAAGLLALQREGDAASPVPRPIPGEIAGRSYQRYLRSFEHPIPERYGSSTTGRGGATAGGAP